MGTSMDVGFGRERKGWDFSRRDRDAIKLLLAHPFVSVRVRFMTTAMAITSNDDASNYIVTGTHD